MSEATATAVEIAPSSETATETASDVTEVGSLLATEETTTSNEETGQAEQDAGEPEGSVELTSLDPAERHRTLQAKLDSGDVLTTPEKQELGRLEQSAADRRRLLQERRDARDKAINTRKQLEATLPDAFLADLGIEDDGSDSFQLRRIKLQGSVPQFVQRFTELANAQLDFDLRQGLVRAGVAKDEADGIETTLELIQRVANHSFEMGQSQATDAKALKTLKDENAALKKQLGDIKDARAKGLSPTTQGDGSASSNGLVIRSKADAANAHATGKITAAQAREYRYSNLPES